MPIQREVRLRATHGREVSEGGPADEPCPPAHVHLLSRTSDLRRHVLVDAGELDVPRGQCACDRDPPAHHESSERHRAPRDGYETVADVHAGFRARHHDGRRDPEFPADRELDALADLRNIEPARAGDFEVVERGPSVDHELLPDGAVKHGAVIPRSAQRLAEQPVAVDVDAARNAQHAVREQARHGVAAERRVAADDDLVGRMLHRQRAAVRAFGRDVKVLYADGLPVDRQVAALGDQQPPGDRRRSHQARGSGDPHVLVIETGLNRLAAAGELDGIGVERARDRHAARQPHSVGRETAARDHHQ